MQRVSTRDKIDRSILCPLLESRLFSSMEYSRVSVQASSIVVLLCSNMVRRTGYNQRSFCSPKWTIFCPRASRFCLLVDKRYPSRFDHLHRSIHFPPCRFSAPALNRLSDPWREGCRECFSIFRVKSVTFHQRRITFISISFTFDFENSIHSIHG